jgi:DNA repair protein RadC
MEALKNQNDLFNVSEIKISYHPQFKAMERPKVNCSEQGYRIMLRQWNRDTISFQEEFKILLLNRNNRVLGVYHIATGGMAGVIVDAKLIFGAALKACASAIMLFHNHPSGNPLPSTEDLKITKSLVEVGRLLGLPVFDHLILTADNGYFSFADEGLM